MKVKKKLYYSCLAVSLMMFIATAFMYFDYQKDIKVLRNIVLNQILNNVDDQSHGFAKINNWIYHNQGFAKNHGYFLIEALGPTPIDVLQKGGDCSDKSRLLMAMLDSVDIDSTLVMLYDAAGVNPTHTIVEVRDSNLNAIADPVFNFVFPKSDSGYYGLSEMRKNPDILTNRLDQLVQLNGEQDKAAYYKRIDESYRFATTINWNKNQVLKTAAMFLKSLNIEPQDLRRPHVLDDPKLFLVYAFFSISLFFLFVAWLIKRI
jgi:hypothetical protein